jgi:hypothetical protein
MAAPARKPPASAKTAPARKPAQLAVVESRPEILLAQHVDELGFLEAELVPIRAKLRRVEVLRELIRRHYEKKPAAASFETRGAHFFATLGACAWQSAIDTEALIKAVGLRRYSELARPTLKALEETLAPDILQKVVSYSYAGARPLKTFAIGE